MPNRLAQSQSLYLRKHAENPIDWWPWCDEAIATARQQDKPIFLSIGYSSCHWCTVMEGEAFSDLEIAEYLNANFLPIKVDREERPDLDSIYMQALQMMTGHGGWPLNAFLTPEDLVPFYGGTYFPMEPRYGQPGFLQLLQAIRRYYDAREEKLESVKREILEQLRLSASGRLGAIAAPLGERGAAFSPDLLAAGLDENRRVLADDRDGPRFPMIPYASFVLRGYAPEGPTDAPLASLPSALVPCARRGMDLALGGIYDAVGGGFHRYTVDPHWTVPHFEKMLYDNGQILKYLADLWSAGVREPAFETAIAGTVEWLAREMTAPEGYFYAAQDADSFAAPGDREPEEGAFYVWSYGALQQCLSEAELSALSAAFFASPEGNFEGKTVLQRREPGPLDPPVREALDRLFAARYGRDRADCDRFPPATTAEEAKTGDWPGRIPPVTDPKGIVAWNGLAISGLARAAAVFQAPVYFRPAAAAAEVLLDRQWQGGRLHRLAYPDGAAVLAQSEDFALAIEALLDLHQAAIALETKAPDLAEEADRWLKAATAMQAEFDRYLWSEEFGGYYNAARDASEDLIVRERSYIDNATPAANGTAIANLVRLFLLTENADYWDRAERGLQAFRTALERAPRACPSLLSGLDWFLHPVSVRATPEAIARLSQQYAPTTVWLRADDLPAGAAGVVCRGTACLEPAADWAQLFEQVRTSHGALRSPAEG